MRLSLFTATIFWLATALLGMAQTGEPRGSAFERVEDHHVGEAVPLIFWNREITVFRAYSEQLSPAQRATNAAERIEAVPETGEWKVEAIEKAGDKSSRMLITVNGKPMFSLMPDDLDPESGETLKGAADHAVVRLRATLEARASQQKWSLLLRSIGLSIAATLFALLGVFLVMRLGREFLSWVEKRSDEGARLQIAGINLRPLAIALQRGAVKLTTWGVEITLAYLWLAFVLMRFPYSQPWGEQLGNFLIKLFERLGTGALSAIPGIFTVMVIFLLTRIAVRMVNGLLREVEVRGTRISWLHPDTAPSTRRLINILMWVFALIIAYPFIPGSNTDAFKGVSFFVGIMLSLGSTGLINQIMSGLVVIYSRALKPGEYVQIGDHEGLVSEVGMLSTKVMTWKREEITIPNAVVVSTKTVNYSRLAAGTGDVVSTAVKIGYDTPWRQVHAMLLLAAERTAGVRKDPRPRVMQKTLADFYVEYLIVVNLDRTEDRTPVLSKLHAQIQDTFNEFGVQIMSPHFQSQPSGRVFVPKPQWFPEPVDMTANTRQ